MEREGSPLQGTASPDSPQASFDTTLVEKGSWERVSLSPGGIKVQAPQAPPLTQQGWGPQYCLVGMNVLALYLASDTTGQGGWETSSQPGEGRGRGLLLGLCWRGRGRGHSSLCGIWLE